MVSETVEGSGSEEKTKTNVVSEKSEVSCWNCFTTELQPDPEPATLPKIRQETRQKYKLYSFFASQLSKPKTIPLTQKVSENYAIGKKVEKRITEKAVQTNITQIEKIKNKSVISDTLDSSVESEGDITKLDISVSDKTPEDDKEKRIQDYIKEYNLFEAYKSIRRKTPTPNSSLQRTKDNINLDSSDVSYNATNSSIENVPTPNYKKLEIVQPKVTIRKVYESPSISITSSTYITKNQENLDALDNSTTQTQTPDVGKEDAVTPKISKVTQRSSITKQDEIVPNIVFQASVSTPRRISSSSSLNKSQQSSTSLNEPPKSQHFVCKSLKIENVNKDKGITSPNLPLISPRRLTPTNSAENIMHKVQIETSTPKIYNKLDDKAMPGQESGSHVKVIQNQNDIDKIIEGIQNISLEIKEQTVPDKTDSASLNESESGYSGSSTRDFQEADIVVKNTVSNRHSTESGNETESPQLSRRIPRPNFKSSLPVLVSRHEDMSVSTKSLATGSSPEANKPVKKLRWSTLGLPHKSTGMKLTFVQYLSQQLFFNKAYPFHF